MLSEMVGALKQTILTNTDLPVRSYESDSLKGPD
jgi:hypothetical protein